VQVTLIDLVWAAALDGQWHTIDDLSERIPKTRAELVEAVSFLAKYGFVESCWKHEKRFRVITASPAPCEVAAELRSLAPELRMT
jgi:hypothetical protein